MQWTTHHKGKTLCCWAGGAWFWSCFLYYIVPTYLFTTSIVISHTLFFFPPILIHEMSIFLLCTTYYKLQAQKHCSIVGKKCAGMYLLFLLNTYNLFWYDLFPNNIIAPYGDTPWSIFWKRFSCVLFFTWMSLDSCFLNKAADIIKDLETNGWTSWKISWCFIRLQLKIITLPRFVVYLEIGHTHRLVGHCNL